MSYFIAAFVRFPLRFCVVRLAWLLLYVVQCIGDWALALLGKHRPDMLDDWWDDVGYDVIYHFIDHTLYCWVCAIHYRWFASHRHKAWYIDRHRRRLNKSGRSFSGVVQGDHIPGL